MSEQNTALVRRFLDQLFNNARPEVIEELMADDYVDHGATPGQEPGAAGARQMYSPRSVSWTITQCLARLHTPIRLGAPESCASDGREQAAADRMTGVPSSTAMSAPRLTTSKFPKSRFLATCPLSSVTVC